MALPKDHDPDVIGVCTECKSDQPAQYLYNSGFGDRSPCKYCGGVIMVVRRENRDLALKQADRERGLT